MLEKLAGHNFFHKRWANLSSKLGEGLLPKYAAVMMKREGRERVVVREDKLSVDRVYP